MKSKAEFFFINGPFLVAEQHPVNEQSPDNQPASADQLPAGTSDEVPPSYEGGGRSWWTWIEDSARPSQAAQYVGWDRSHITIRDALKEYWPVDVVLGFSQGATAAALYLADEHNHKDHRGGVKHVPQSAIIISGFLPRDPDYANRITASRIPVRSLHIAGENDELVDMERSKVLWSQFEHPTIFLHPGAHMVPTCTGDFKRVLKDFLEDLTSV